MLAPRCRGSRFQVCASIALAAACSAPPLSRQRGISTHRSTTSRCCLSRRTPRRGRPSRRGWPSCPGILLCNGRIVCTTYPPPQPCPCIAPRWSRAAASRVRRACGAAWPWPCARGWPFRGAASRFPPPGIRGSWRAASPWFGGRRRSARCAPKLSFGTDPLPFCR